MLEGFRWQLKLCGGMSASCPGTFRRPLTWPAWFRCYRSKAKDVRPVDELTAYAYFLEHEGRLEEALELLTLAARSQGPKTSTADFAAYALFAGRLNRLLARWEAASTCYTAAEDAGIRSRPGRGTARPSGTRRRAARAGATIRRREHCGKRCPGSSELKLTECKAMAYADLGAVYNFRVSSLESC